MGGSLNCTVAAVALMGLCGCCADGGWHYVVKGRLIDARDGQPLRDEDVAVTFDNPVRGPLARPDELPRSTIETTTYHDGSLVIDLGTGIIWGTCCPIFYSPPPAPPLTGISVAPFAANYREQLVPSGEVVNDCRRTQCQVDIGTVFVLPATK